MKIDVEGAEWESFLKASAATLDRIDQIATEMHGVNERRYLAAVKKLKQHFYVAYLHFNNHTCDDAMSPFPAEVYEVLFVNKRLGVPDPSGKPWTPHPAAARNHPRWPDCQTFPR